jgi:exopolysaccharide production protein ExoZ
VIRNIQALRALAALAVVWHHLQTQMSLYLGMPHLGYVGRAGVDVFFVISGFIMFHTTRDGERATTDFWSDRIARIVPAYWLLTVFAAALFWFGLHPGDIKGLSATDVAEDMLFLPHFRADGDAYPVLDVGWTLNFEMFFYALFGLSFFLKSQGKSLAVLTGVFLLGAALVHLHAPLPNTVTALLQPITLEFAAGGALALLYPRAQALSRTTAIGVGTAAFGVGLVAILVGGTLFGKDVSWNYELRAMIFGLPATLIVAGALMLETANVTVQSRLLLLLGAASYSIYLVHHLAVQFMVRLAGGVSPHPSLPALLAEGAAIFAVAVLAGIAVHMWIEQPASRWLRRRMHRRPVAAPVAS